MQTNTVNNDSYRVQFGLSSEFLESAEKSWAPCLCKFLTSESFDKK